MTVHGLGDSLAPFKAWFDAHAGRTRLVAIASPT